MDYAHEVFEARKPSSPDSGLRKALRGPLDWVITGIVERVPTPKEISVNLSSCDKNLHDLVENFWKLEAFSTRSAPGDSLGRQNYEVSAAHNWS